MALFAKHVVAFGAICLAASSLGAQATKTAAATPAAPACDLPMSKGSLGKASFMFEQARSSLGTPAAAATALKNTVKTLDTPDKADDPTARAMLLGQTLSLWLGQPNIGYTPKRSTLGFTSNPEATIDLPSTVDSLFRVVETAKPVCAKQTTDFRQYAYRESANSAINALNAQKNDSAEFYATQVTRLYPASPYGPMILGSVASAKGDNAKALQLWSQSATNAAADTSYRDVRRQMLNNIGLTYLKEANSASGTARQGAARKAAEAYGQLIEVPGTTGGYLHTGRTNMQNALLLEGDTAALVKSYQPLLAASASYDYTDLLNSAVNAARAMKSADAAKLFEATLTKNPYSRDALYNLAVVYLTLEQNDKVAPIVKRLVEVDPANSENYNLAARAYLALSKAARTAKNTTGAAAYNDSTVSWFNRGTKVQSEVVFTEFSPSEKQAVLGGTVTDRRDKAETGAAAAPAPARGAKTKAKAPASKTFVPKPVTVNFEALDATGAVVGKGSTTTDALTPGKSASFKVTIQGANVAGYRYTISG